MSEENLWDVVAVLPMRMQTEDFAIDVHPGHWALVDEVAQQHRDILIVLGVPHTYEVEDNPLNFEMRKEMFLSAAKIAWPENNFTVVPSLSRNYDYPTRSRLYDEMLIEMYPDRRVITYGARKSFIHKYTGNLETREVETTYCGSATTLREEIEVRHTRDFRAGVIWTKQNQKAMGFPAVDVLIANRNVGQLILVKKNHESGWRFPGVLFDPDADDSFESAAERTVRKELPTVSTMTPYILASKRLEDWRLKRSKHKIITVFAFAGHSSGDPSPGQGVDEAKWFRFGDLMPALVEEHKPLGEIARKNGIR